MSRFLADKTHLGNHSGYAAKTEHHVVKRILAGLLAATCMMGASAANVPPTVAITNPSGTNISYPAPGVITLQATAFDTDGIAKVDYYFGTTYIGRGTAAPPYTYVWGGVPIRASYSVTAKATDKLGAVTTSAPVLIQVKANVPPTTEFEAPVDNATFTAPAVILLKAKPKDIDGKITKVQFYNGEALLGEAKAEPFNFNWTNVAAGSYTVRAIATDNKLIAGPAASISVVVNPSGNVPSAQLFFIYSDQINTAREITNTAGVKVWQADPEPFGANPPNENPAGQGQFTYNQRFPGQYYDRETGLHYNYYRDYDPQTGRYVQSDPIGLGGGINTYGYVEGNPVSKIDPTGEFAVALLIPYIPAATAFVKATFFVGSAAGVAYGVHKATSGDSSQADPMQAGNGGVGNSSGIGTNTPYKHCRDLKGRPGWIECKNKSDGKWVPKPAPAGWPFKKEVCETMS